MEGTSQTVEQHRPGDARRAAFQSLRRQHQAIRRRLNKNCGNVAQTARELGVKRETVKRIRDGAGLPVNRRPGEAIRGERIEERAAVRVWLERSGGNVKRTTRMTGVPESTVRRWKTEWVRAAQNWLTSVGQGSTP